MDTLDSPAIVDGRVYPTGTQWRFVVAAAQAAYRRQTTPPVMGSCRTCKHKEAPRSIDPCKACIEHDGPSFSRWEAR